MCEPHFNTLRTSWYNIKKSIENYPTCLNIIRVGKFFQNTWTKGCHVSISMVIVKYLLMYQKILIHHSHVVWPTHSIYHYFFTHNELMVTYKKLTFTLLEILSFATCFMQLKNVACNSKIVACEIF